MKIENIIENSQTPSADSARDYSCKGNPSKDCPLEPEQRPIRPVGTPSIELETAPTQPPRRLELETQNGTVVLEVNPILPQKLQAALLIRK